MAETRVYVHTWGCECGYSQDFPIDNPELWEQHIVLDRRLMATGNERGIAEPPLGKCPACWLGLNDERTVHDRDLAGIVDLAALSVTTVKDPDALDEQVKETRSYDRETGDPVMTEVPLTKKEKDAAREKIKRAHDDVAAREFDPRQVG